MSPQDPISRRSARWRDACVACLSAIAVATPVAAAWLTPERGHVRATRTVAVLPEATPTHWTGARDVRATRGRAPAWAQELAVDRGRLPARLALGATTHTIDIADPAPTALIAAAGDDARWAAVDDQAAFDRTGPIAPTPLDRPRLRPDRAIAAAAPAARPEIVIVLTAVGLNEAASRAALERLPQEVAVAIAPVARNPAAWIERAARRGRVRLLELPMEPTSYPRVNPGPLTLLADDPAADNLARMARTLARAPAVDGVATYLGDRFLADASALGPIAEDLKRRELFLLDADGSGAVAADVAAERRLPFAAASLSLDNQGRLRDIEPRLRELERQARASGRAVGVAVARPQTVSALGAWLDDLDARGFQLTALRPS